MNEINQRDAELGRWRSKHHPDYVVYQQPNKATIILLILDERTGKNTLDRPTLALERNPDPVIREIGTEWAEENVGNAKPWEIARAFWDKVNAGEKQ